VTPPTKAALRRKRSRFSCGSHNSKTMTTRRKTITPKMLHRCWVTAVDDLVPTRNQAAITFNVSGMPDTDAAIIRPLWGGVQRKARIASDGWNAHSETEEREGMDSDGYGSVFRHEPWSHLRHRTRKAGSWIDNASDYRPWPSTTVLQESAQAAWAPWQRSGEVGCDLTAQGGNGLRIMPFCPYG